MDPSPAAQIILSIVPIVGIVMGSGVIFFYLLWMHKQRILKIEKGVYEKQRFDLLTFSLLTGLLLSSVGVVLSIFFIAMEGCSYGLLGGLIPLATGVSLLVFFVIRKNMHGLKE